VCPYLFFIIWWNSKLLICPFRGIWVFKLTLNTKPENQKKKKVVTSSHLSHTYGRNAAQPDKAHSPKRLIIPGVQFMFKMA